MWKREMDRLRRLQAAYQPNEILVTIAQEMGINPSSVYRWVEGKTVPYRRRRKALKEILNKYEKIAPPPLTNGNS